MNEVVLDPTVQLLVAALARRYLWWESIALRGHSPARMLAQIMRFGTYEDIRQLEKMVGSETLAVVMQRAEPGWLDARSWDFWRGRLIRAGARGIPELPPRRRFADAEAP